MRTYRYLLIAIAALCVALMVHAAGSLHVAAGTWVNGPAMSAERTSAATVLMPDGRLLITGGRDANGNALTSAEFVNSDGSISEAPSMAIARSGHSAVWLPTGYVLVAGGTTSGGGVTNTAELFDPLANNWVTLPSTLVEARTDFTATVLRFGNVVIAGGTHAGAPVSTVEVFDVSQETFSSVGALSVARANVAAAAISDWKVLVAGGSDVNGSTLASTELIDTEAGTITAGPVLGEARKSASATVLLDGRVLIAGGSHPEAAEANGGVAELATTEIFDAAAGAISAGPALSSARSEHQAFLLPNNNGVLLVGGVRAGQDLASADLYSPSTGSFAEQPSMSAARTKGTGSAMYGTAFRYGTDGVLLLAGGSNQNSSEFYGFATVETDKDDYAPGTPVIITGSGWVPGETVRLSLLESPNLDTHTLTPVVADANGNIYSSEFAPDASDIGLKFYVTAIGSKSMAQNVFKDAVTVTLTPSSGAVGTLVSLTTGGGGFAGGASASVFFDPISTAVANCTANNGGNIVSGCTFTVPTTTTGGHTVTIKNSTDSYTGSFTITGKATPTVTTWPSASAITYGDSLALSTLSGGVASVPGNFAFTTPSTKPSSGTYSAAVTFTPTDTSSYNTVSGSVNVIVNKAVLTITADDKSMVFGGAVPALTYTPAGFKNSETSAVLTGSPTLSTTATTSSPVGNYPITAAVGTLAATNYSFTFVNGNLAVGKADVTVAWSTTTATYDGSPHAITATPTPSAAALTITYTGTDNGGANYNSTTPPTNAGSYTATATLSNTTNYKFAAAAQTTSSFTISKADPTVTATGGNFPYDTTAKTGSGSATGVGSVSLTPAVTLSYEDSAQNAIASAPVNAGSYYVVAHFVGNGNYNAKDSSPAAITIAKATPVVHVADVNATYDGSAHPATGTVTGVNDVSLGAATITYTPGGATEPVNAGTYAVLASYTGSENYESASANATVKIAKADTTTVVTFEAGPYVYRASAFTATATATGAGNLNQSPTVSYSGDCVNVSASNGCTASASYAGDDNHNPSSNTKSITIEKATSTTVVTFEAGPYTYRGSAFTATVNVTGVGTLSLTPDPTYTGDCINVTSTDGCSATYNFDGDQNHTGSSDTKHITINKASSTTVVSFGSGPFVYTGSAFTATVHVTGVGNLSLTPAPTYGGDCINVTGTDGCSATYTFDGDANHTGSSDTKKITIDKASSSTVVSFGSGPFVYNGSAFTATVQLTGANLNESPAPTYGGDCTNVTAADGCSATYTFAGDANHTGSSDTKKITIDKASSSTVVSFGSGPFIYAGSAFTATVQVTGANLTLNPAPTYGGDCINVTSANGCSATYSFAGDANHTGSSDTKNITIDKASSSTVVSFGSGPFVYTGSAFTATVQLTGANLNQSPAPTYGGDCVNVTAANGCSATYTFAGDANHTGSTDTKSITIDKASSSTVVSFGSGPFVYTGSAFTATVQVTGANLNQSPAPTYGGDCINVTSANGCSATYSFAGDANHTGSSDTKNITIDKASSSTVVSFGSGPFVYTGSAFTASVQVTGANLGLNPAPIYSGDCVNVTTTNGCSASYNFGGDQNHVGSTHSASITITKAPSSVTIEPGFTVVFDGKTHGVSANVTGAGGLNQPVTVTYNPGGSTLPLYPGSYTASAMYPGDFNHSASAPVSSIINIIYGTCSAAVGPGNIILPPINSDGSSVYNRKGGSTIPVKFRVCDASGNSIFDPAAVFGTSAGSITMLSAVRGTVTVVNESTTADIPDVAFRYSGGQWIFNMATSNLDSGSTYVFRINLKNGSSILFQVGVK